MGGGWRHQVAALLLVVLAPAGCGCSGECESSVQFGFPEVMRTVPLGSIATACVETTCLAFAPDQETGTVFMGDGEDDSNDVAATLTIRNKAGEVVFDRKTPLKLKAHKSGRFCGTACRTGAITFRP